MPKVINAQSTADDYTAAASISGVISSQGGFYTVSNADVFCELEYGPQGQLQHTAEFPVSNQLLGIGQIQAGATGIRFRSYNAGSPAVVTAVIFYPREPIVIGLGAGPTVMTGLAYSQSTPAAASIAGGVGSKMAGLAGSITPNASGRVYVSLAGDFTEAGGAASTGSVQLRYGIGAAPANNAALTGTTVGSFVRITPAALATSVPFALIGIIVGLTPGVAYWLDISLGAGAATTTVTVADTTLDAIEF